MSSMTYSELAQSYAHAVLDEKTRKSLAKRPVYAEMYRILNDETSFLDPGAQIKERAIYVIEERHEPRICPVCGKNQLRYFNKKRRFQTACSVYCARRNPIERKKRAQTNLDQYGVENPFQSEQVKIEIRQANLETIGVEHPFYSKQYQQRRQEIFVKKYGVSSPTQVHCKDAIDKLLEPNWLQKQLETKTAKEIAAELDISINVVYVYGRKMDVTRNRGNDYSMAAITWLDAIMLEQGIHIQHAKNGGEYRIPGTRIRVDGFCEETNTIYEFHGDKFHGNPALFQPDDRCHPFTDETAGDLYDKTVERENKIRSLGYNLIVKWETQL